MFIPKKEKEKEKEKQCEKEGELEVIKCLMASTRTCSRQS
jgi:hypothetical protein